MKALAALTGACALAAASVIAFGSDARPRGGCLPGDTPVSISGFAFSPGSVTIAPGSTICWTNKDSYTHTVTSNTGVFNSGPLDQDETFRHTFPSNGTYRYDCAIVGHDMPGTIEVETAPAAASAAFPSSSAASLPRPATATARRPARPPVRLGVRLRIARSGGSRWLVAHARVTMAAPARLQLLRRNRTVASARQRFRAGRNELRLRLRRSLPRGTYLARLTIGGVARPYTTRIPIG